MLIIHSHSLKSALVRIICPFAFCSIFSFSSIAQEVDNPDLERTIKIGLDLIRAEEFDKAMVHFENEADTYGLAREWQAYYTLKAHSVQVFLDRGSYEEAHSAIQSTLSKYHELPENEKSKDILGLLQLKEGIALYRNQFHSLALVQLQSAATVFEDRTDSLSLDHLSVSLDYQGKCFNFLRQYKQGLEVLFQAHEIQSELLGESHSLTMNTLRNIGDAYHSSGYHDLAIKSQNRALELSESIGDDAASARCYHELSKIYQHKRDFVKSREFGLKALELNKQIFGEKHGQVAKMMHQIGNAIFAEKEYEEALDWYHRSIEMRLELYGRHIYNSALTTMNLGKVYGVIGEYEKSIEKFNECWSAFDDLLPPDHARYSELWLSMGEMYKKMGREDKAHSLFTMAHSRAYEKAAEKSFDRAVACLSLASTISDPDEALLMCQQGLWEQTIDWEFNSVHELPRLEQIPNEYWVLRLLDTKGDIWVRKFYQTGNPENLLDALNSYQRASELIDYSREAFFNEGAKKAIANEGRDIYEKGVEVSFLLDSMSYELPNLANAFNFMEKSRSLVLLEAVNDQVHGLQYVPDSLQMVRQSLKTQIQKIDIEIAQYEAGDEVLESLNADVFQFKNELADLEAQIDLSYPQLRSLKLGTQSIKPSEIQEILLTDELFIEFLETEDRLYALTISPAEFDLKQLDIEVLSEVRDLLKMCKSIENAERRGNDTGLFKEFTTLSHSIFLALIEPLNLRTSGSLIIVPDGILSFLPFELLIKDLPEEINQTDYSELDYLIKTHDVRYAFSANLVLYQNEDFNYEEDNILAFAPEYENSSNEILASRSGFTSLKHIAEEAETVVDLIGGALYTANSASERNFKILAPKFRFLHLAMHAFTDEDSPLESGLIFTDLDDGEDNVLHTYELYNMNLPAEMVVLSACNTGSGKLVKGEGVMSLARGFRQAGVPNIVMSLWQADDESTRLIMQKFYQLLKQGVPKHRALRTAKLEYLSESPKTFPYFWSAFVLMGDHTPIALDAWWESPVLAFFGLGTVILIFVLVRLKGKRRPLVE